MPHSNRTKASSWTSRLLPLALVLLCSTWVFQFHVYVPSQARWIPWLLYAIACFLLFIRIWNGSGEPWTERFASPSWAIPLGVAACLLAFLIFPFPYSLGAVPLGVGWIFLPLLRRNSMAGFCSAALFQVGLLLLVCAALLPFVFAWTARVHELPRLAFFLGPAVNWLLQALGQRADFIGGALHLRTFEELYPATLTTEKLFPIPLVLFAAIWSAVILIRSEVRRMERLILFWILTVVYAIIRLTVLLLIMIQRVNPSYFWDPLFMTLSLIPLGLVVSEPSDLLLSPRSSGSTSHAKPRAGFGLILGLILGGCAIIGWTFRDPGEQKAGRLLINGHGSDWEWTTEPMDTAVYNEKTTYNYYCLAEYLRYYFDVAANFELLSPDILKDVDVLILKMPTEPYAPEEIDAVVNFVRSGGGLWVIGDHTNVFGSSSFLNPLLRRFGYRLNYDSTHDLQTGKLTLYEKPPIFAHPSVINLPPYLFATSCSMVAPWSADAAILGYGLRVDHLDYSQKNFFPDRSRKQFDHGFGLFLQQAGGRYGKGRLLIYTDSTTFSNFFMFIKGKPELALGSLSWLNRSNSYHWIKPVSLIVAFLALVLLFLGSGWNAAALAGIILGASLMGWLTNESALSSYPLPQPKRAVPWVSFEREHSQYFLPTLRLGEEGDESYLTFFVWTQRVGAVPREVYDFKEAVSSPNPIILIDPMVPFDDGEKKDLNTYLENGGNLLVVNSADNASAVPAHVLAEYGLTLNNIPSTVDSLHTLMLAGRYFPLNVKGKFSSISGGEPFLRSDRGDVIGATVGVGDGRLWALSCGHLFRNSSMGQTTVVPDSGLKALYQIEFNLIRSMLSKSQDEMLRDLTSQHFDEDNAYSNSR